MKGRSKSMDTSSHTILDLLFEDGMDQSSHHQSHNHYCERPVIRSMSIDGSCHLQLKNRFDAVTEERNNFNSNSNMTDLTFLAKTKSPRRPERQPSMLPRNNHDNVSNNRHSDNDDTSATTTANTNRRCHRPSSPSTHQQLPPLPPLVVFIQKHHFTGDSARNKIVGNILSVQSNCGSSALATEFPQQHLEPPEVKCHSSATSPRRPIRKPSCVIASPVSAAPTVITTLGGEESSPRRPVRRPSVR
jgi:hypothetical protein